MARSTRHTPIIGVCTYGAGAMRLFRKQTNKKLRAQTKRAIDNAAADFEAVDVIDPRTPNAVIERWNAPDDGRMFMPKPQPRFLRK